MIADAHPCSFQRWPCCIVLLVCMIATARLANAQSFVPDWVKDAVFYQIFPERFANGDTTNDPAGILPWGATPTSRSYFGGDLRGIIDHLDYIAGLGCNALYLNPIFESNSNHKYHATDYLKIDPHFGDEETFRTLVDECHARGVRIILDGVWNHTGVQFFAFDDIRKHGADSRYVKWYNIYSFPVGPPSKPNYECWWGYGDLPKLMTGNPEVRDYLFDVTRHWMSFGIDGWRLDVPNEIPHPFWVEWRHLVKEINPDAYIVGEIWDDATPWLQGDQFDGVMNYRFRNACVDFFARGTMSVQAFDDSLARVRDEYPDDVPYAVQNLLGSHDTERFLTLCNGNTDRLQLAWLMQMTSVGAPMVYYGDEVGMTGGKDPLCRGTMVWDRRKQNTLLLTTMKNLIALRNRYAVLRRGTSATLHADAATGTYAFVRRLEDTSAVVILNNSGKTRRFGFDLASEEKGMKWDQVWVTPRSRGKGQRGAPLTFPTRMSLPAYSGIVFIGGRGQQ